MRKEKTIDICHKYLFEDVDRMKNEGVSTQMINRVKRIRTIYTIWIDYPTKKDKEMRDKLISMYDISQSEAYEDIRIIKQLLGDFNSASKSYHRFRVNAMFLEAFELARIKKNPIAQTMAADKYAKYNQLDKEDALEYPWEDIIPQNYEPSSDPTLLGIKPIANIQEKIAALKKKYNADIEDVDFEEIGISQSLLNDLKKYE